MIVVTKEKKQEKTNQKTNEEQTQKNTQEVDDLKNTVQRVQAEFENYKKRTAREQEIFRQHATQGLIKELLPVIDNIHIALTNNDKEDEFSKSIELTYAQLMETLQGHGVQRIDAKDKAFDPRLHEALITKESDKKPHTVLEVLQEGYTINDKVLRTAKVAVSKTK